MKGIEPCEMCGRYDGDNKEKWEKRENEISQINLILTGILFANKSTKRQEEIFLAKYYIGRENLTVIGDDFNISKSTVKEHLDRATDLISNIIKSI
jgi:predicted DNA-binding protein YlxM (UPF0122 family)|tara:strand:+ start:99 stop:386 length:288 start_codon:yes stop_codon:yes gene_type:complete